MAGIKAFFLLLILAPALCPASAGNAETTSATFAPTSQYTVLRIEGWPVRVLKSFSADDPQLCERTLKLLGTQLAEIVRRVSGPAVDRLREVTIWVEERETHHPCMVYHPSRQWLTEHGMNPDKGRCVEIANARNFLRWTLDQPVMVLHELAHAYMDQFLDAGGNERIQAAYRDAMKAGRYEAVLRIQGKTERAYAMNNAKEYFAEGTEAFFGTNDFYPFVSAELKLHDPELYDLLGGLWGKPAKKPSS